MLEKKEIISLIKALFISFLIFFIIFNWGKISWIFNYKAVSITLSRIFSKEKKLIPQLTVTPPPTPQIEDVFEFTEKENSLEIPSIEIFAPFSLVKSADEKEILAKLDKGPVMFSDNSLPGENGATVILGHSARHDWPKSNPTWAFTYLRDVKEDDEIILNFEHKKYKYFVEKIYVLKKGENIPMVENENILFLITCWPPGRLSFEQRLVVEAKLKK